MKNGTNAGARNLYLVLAGLGLVLAAGVFFFLWQKDAPARTSEKPVIETPVTTAAPVSSTHVPERKQAREELVDGEESTYGAYRVIDNSIALPGIKLVFGDKVFADERKSGGPRKIILLKEPYKYPGSTAYQVNAGSLIEEYRFEDYKRNFSLAPFSGLSPALKNVLLAAQYSEGNKYTITQNAERAGNCLASGDFDGDGIRDIAVLMDNNEKQVCRLLFICTNKTTRQPYVAFAENYADRMKLRGFRKQAPVYMNTEHFVPAPRDGIIVQGEDVVLALIYDSSLQKFKTYYQE